MTEDDEQKQIEEFRASWDRVENFYLEYLVERPKSLLMPIIPLIHEMRLSLYDECFRASHRVYTLELSRNLENSWMQFAIIDASSMTVVAKLNKKRHFLLKQPLKLSNEVKLLIELLMAQPTE